MRILDDESDKKLDRITLYLTKDEIKQLLGYAKQLLNEASSDHHHLFNEDYQKEIVICIYEQKKLDFFDERSKKLILFDE